MVYNPFSAVRGRFFQKLRVVDNLNDLCIGRKEDETPGVLRSAITMRTGFWGGRIHINSIPKEAIITIPAGYSPQFPEGIDYILPFQKDSPGWHFFHQLPLFKLSQVERALKEKERELAAIIETGQVKTPEELMQWASEMMDLLSDMRKKGEINIPEAPMVVPTEKGKEK